MTKSNLANFRRAKSIAKASGPLQVILVLVLVVILPLLYRFHYLAPDWVNRIGIVLNFLGAFMIAPELLGARRIKRAAALIALPPVNFSVWLNDHLADWNEKVADFEDKAVAQLKAEIAFLEEEAAEIRSSKKDESVLSSHAVRDFIASNKNDPNLHTIVTAYAILWNEIRTGWPLFWGQIKMVGILFWGNIKHDVKTLLFLAFFAIMGWLASAALSLGERVGNAVDTIAFLVMVIKLRDVLTRWGILFLIIGNLLQLMATFR